MQETTNKNKLTPRQVLFLQNYLDPASPTFSVVRASGIGAGFGKRYSEKLATLMPDWLGDIMQNNAMVAKAERNLREMIDMDIKEDVIGAFGPIFDRKTKEVCKKDNTKKLAIKADMTKFVLERLNKNKWASKMEETKAPIQLNIGLKEAIEKVYGNKNT